MVKLRIITAYTALPYDQPSMLEKIAAPITQKTTRASALQARSYICDILRSSVPSI
jgi:hypothetical protein